MMMVRLFVLLLSLQQTTSFVLSSRNSRSVTNLFATTEQLLQAIDSEAKATTIQRLVTDIETSASNNTDFEGLLGLYHVAHVVKAREGDNPVGGRWTRSSGIAQKLLRTRKLTTNNQLISRVKLTYLTTV
jgi:hypothetical protein